MIEIKKGLDVPIAGSPTREIGQFMPKQVALLGADYIGMKPSMLVQVGDTVAKGQPLFTDKKREGVIFTAPASGKVVAINRGERRVFESLVIEIDNGIEPIRFRQYASQDLLNLPRDTVVKQLVESGEWTAFRTRPFSRTPAVDSEPKAIFVNMMDTNPLAFDPMALIGEDWQGFNDGLAVLSKLAPTLFVCHDAKASQAVQTNALQSTNIRYHAFAGKHPAGLAGTHIHFLNPVGRGVTVWTIGYQDVIAIGKLFTTGELYNVRLIALAGPQVTNPRLMVTERGADLLALTQGELKAGDNRVISGSVLSGRQAIDNMGYLGRFHHQVSVLAEGHERPAMHFFSLGANRFSQMPIYISQFFKGKKFAMTTSNNGSPRAMVPTGSYEAVMPLDILATQLLRALIVEDILVAEDLGALELDEEDLALCTFVCSGKYEYGDILRDNLHRIEMEG
ncbi:MULTISPECIES: Na(+)-translocating NADH-quinone reductase subunit A [unclassified Moraxella]|uniref:Na(+)-translocating NADH-quinone reductase subunit A n=1 Tax=unclassified Moraxella TaxID=2685852 RepID=UPI003AF46EA0